MKARIASELRRSNITSAIASAITTAIEAYRGERFAYTEKRDVTFSTVDAQEFYTSSDNANIALLEKIDYVTLYIGNQPYPVVRAAPEWMEYASVNGTQEGQPSYYTWHQNKLRLSPVPNAVYTMRVAGNYQIAAPATDGEASNPWMTTAEELIRCRAKYELYMHVLLDGEKASGFHPEPPIGAPSTPTSRALSKLRGRTNLLTGSGRISPMPF